MRIFSGSRDFLGSSGELISSLELRR